MSEAKQSTGRVRRWLDRRREARKRGAEIAERAKAGRKRTIRDTVPQPGDGGSDTRHAGGGWL